MVDSLEIKKMLYDYTSVRTCESWITTLIKRLIEKNGKIDETDISVVENMLHILKIVGDHITDKQLRNFLNQLKYFELIRAEGESGQMVYMFGDSDIHV